ncbi:SDR family NAD(P)-dependent oxidoreductase [Microbacterium sp.]|uniref:pyridoxal 4-dehydrogenase, SDR-type n=1 Tax=Microbacterium sp. TaxID=51671 RepID=UPI00092B3A96|nr:SDR family NAD(P)-dependent oxidoreductase [Microbacterium sp.]MBN9193837.1 SDR family oxidoreductase [Microbacterium sp.]OJU70063.1 MAG: pyridoxal 4-dehydrogenase [Microbacterium sp. 70-38]
MTERVAIVTGAAQGIGAAIAKELAADGVKVVVTDVNLEGATAVAAEIGGVVKLLDVSDPAQADAVVAEVVTELGRLDILVNNAGLVPYTPFDDLTIEQWRRTFAVNGEGLFNMTKAAVEAMKPTGYGRIVNIASNTFVAGTPNCADYVATKGAVVGFTRAVAGEIGRYGININAVAPGIIASEGVFTTGHGDGFDYVVPMQAFDRRGVPADVAPAVAFLASEKAAWITGQLLVVDGGHTRN